MRPSVMYRVYCTIVPCQQAYVNQWSSEESIGANAKSLFCHAVKRWSLLLEGETGFTDSWVHLST